MYLGLDLRGGVHFLMEVDLAGAVRQAEQRYAGDLRTLLREEKLRQRAITVRSNGGLIVRFNDAGHRDRAYDLVRRRMPELIVESTVNVGDPVLDIQARRVGEARDRALRGPAERPDAAQPGQRARRRRAGHPEAGREPDRRPVARCAGHRAGEGDPRRHRDAGVPHGPRRIRDGARDGTHAGDREALPRAQRRADPPPAQRHAHRRVHHGRGVGDRSAKRLAGGIHHPRRQGARLFSSRTRDKIGRPMAVVYIEHKSFTELVDGVRKRKKEIVEEVINVATIRDQLGKRFQITGLDTTEEARKPRPAAARGSARGPPSRSWRSAPWVRAWARRTSIRDSGPW